MIFFGSSNAVKNLRNDFPTRPRQPTSKARKRTVNHFSAIRFANLSLRFMPVRHARFHWTSKFADNDVFGGFVDENDVGFEL
jgi:hypothetical protein